MAAAAILNLLFLSILVNFLVTAVYISAKFYSSTSIGGRVVAVGPPT